MSNGYTDTYKTHNLKPILDHYRYHKNQQGQLSENGPALLKADIAAISVTPGRRSSAVCLSRHLYNAAPAG